MVSATTIHAGIPYDPACIVKEGDHPFIRHDSYMYYRQARVTPVDHTMEMVASGVWTPKDPFSTALMHRVMHGAFTSRQMNREIRNILEV